MRVATLTEKGSKSTFDFRGTKAGEALGKRVGDLGKPAKDGYAGQVKQQTEAYTKYAKSLKQTEKARRTAEALKAERAAAVAGKEKAVKDWGNRRKDIQDKAGRLQSDIKDNDETRSRALELQKKKVEAAIAGGDNATRTQEEAEFKRMEEKYKADREQELSELQNIQSALTSEEAAHKETVKNFDAQIKSIDLKLKGDMDKGIAGFDADSSKRAFGIRLKNSKFPTNGKARSKAFDDIKKELKKTKTEKALEGLKESIAKGSHDTEDKIDEVKHALEESPNHEGSGHDTETHH
jgi:hypothetical protein